MEVNNMDRLKFRRPIYKNNKFLGFQYSEVGKFTEIGSTENISFGEWEQCTGLKDKNNTLIWQNDIILLVANRGYHDDKGNKYVIEFGTFRFCGFGYRVKENYEVEYALTRAASKKMVVIGNVYEGENITL